MFVGRYNDYPLGGEPVLTPELLEYERIAVDQPPGGGSAYPFARGHVLGALVADFYLAVPRVAGPVRLVWLHGFGLIPAAPPPDTPDPVHPRELLVADAAGAVVFDSTAATAYHDVGWGARRVVEWVTPAGVARLVFYMGQLGVWPAEIAYADAVLDPRTCVPVPLRVRTVAVGGVASGGAIELAGGFNLALEPAPAVAGGGRSTAAVTIAAVAGAGQGRKSDCAETVATLNTINGIAPDGRGNFRIEASGCYRLERVVAVDPRGPGRLARFAAAEDRASLRLSNDCGPCCTCDDFVSTYRGLSRVHGDWATVSHNAEAARDRYRDNAARWASQKECRAAQALRAIAVREPACKVFVGTSFCNPTPCCITQGEVRLTIQRRTDGAVDWDEVPTDIAVVAAYVSGPTTDGDQRYAPEVRYAAGAAVVRCLFDAAMPGAAILAKLRILIPCGDRQTADIVVSMHGRSNLGCTLPTAGVAAEVLGIWAGAGPLDVIPLALTRVLAPLTPDAF